MRLIFTIFLLLAPSFSYACGAPSWSFSLSNEELVKKTKTIVLAKVTQIEDRKVHFKKVRLLKGTIEDSFVESYRRLKPRYKEIDESYYDNDFDNHTDTKFWVDDAEQAIGRTIGAVCGKPYPVFKVGETYLFFREAYVHVKAHELIRSDNDKWLEYVESQIAKHNQASKKDAKNSAF